PTGTDPLKRVGTALLDLARQAGLPAATEKGIGDLLHRVESVAAAGLSLTLREQPGPEPYTTLTELLLEIGRAAIARGDVVALIHIDEVQNITSEAALSQLLIALGDALAHEETVTAPGGMAISRALPIAVYLTGLPEFADMAGARKGATFARRFQSTTLTPLEDDDLSAALQTFLLAGWDVPSQGGGISHVHMEPAAGELMAELEPEDRTLTRIAAEMGFAKVSDAGVTAQRLDSSRGIIRRGEAVLVPPPGGRGVPDERLAGRVLTLPTPGGRRPLRLRSP